MNTVTAEIKILERKFEAEKAEELEIELYQKKMGGVDSETSISLR